MADEHVLRHAQVGEQPRLLVDDGDAQGARLGRPVDESRRPVEEDGPGVGLVDAGKDLDERALARPVLADQRVDLAGAQVQRHVGQGRRGPEPLADTAELHAGRLGFSHGRGRDDGRGAGHEAASVRCGFASPRPAVPTRRTSTPIPTSCATMSCGRLVVRDDGGDAVEAAERRGRDAAPLGVVDQGVDLVGGRDHGALDLRLLLHRVREAGLQGETDGADERLLDVDAPEDPVAQRADDRERLPADPAAEQEHGDARVAGQLHRDPDAVGDDRQLVPVLALLEVACDRQGRGRGVEDDAVAVLDQCRGGGPDARLLRALEPLADVERQLRAARRAGGDGAAVGPDEATLTLEDEEILADRDRRHAEASRQLRDAGTTRLGHDLGDLLLALPREHCLGQVGCRRGQVQLRVSKFDWLRLRTLCIGYAGDVKPNLNKSAMVRSLAPSRGAPPWPVLSRRAAGRPCAPRGGTRMRGPRAHRPARTGR